MSAAGLRDRLGARAIAARAEGRRALIAVALGAALGLIVALFARREPAHRER